MSDEPLRLGLIGLGRWGRAFARTVAQLEDVSLVYVATSEPGRLSDLGFGRDVATAPNWRDVATARDLDGVILAVPPQVQPTIIREAVGVGVPVLAEKPLALSIEEAEDVRRHVVEHRGFVLVDHTQVFSPSYEALRDIVRISGGIERIETVAGGWGPFRSNVPVLWDWGAHDVAMCIDLLGSTPISATAAVRERHEMPEGPGERIEIRLAFRGGVTARCEVSNIASERRRSFAAHLQYESLVFEDQGSHRLMRRRHGSTAPAELIATSAEAPLRRVIIAFASAIRHGGDMSSLDLGVEVVRALGNAEASLRA